MAAITTTIGLPVARRRSRRAVDILKHPTVVASALVLATMVFVAIAAPLIAPYDPYEQHLEGRLGPPLWAGGSLTHPFGTDQLGRDVLTRLMYGARVSIAIGVMAVLVSGVLGVAAGVTAGFYGGIVDELLMRLADLRLALPFVLLVISVIAVFGPSFTNLIVILGLTGWVPYAKIVRAEALSMREREFIVAARAVGARNSRLMFRHILPNTVAAAIVIGSLELANIIVVEASLSFLGLGVQAPTPSWGNMLGEARDYLMSNFWLATLPGIAISVTAISVNLIGDWLRDVLDPRIQT
ncbi:MAG: ABC transporter permease [Chloroflexi bacterium]|nr:MAG: ABC transporter permease [Chloroflexota bacterium]